MQRMLLTGLFGLLLTLAPHVTMAVSNCSVDADCGGGQKCVSGVCTTTTTTVSPAPGADQGDDAQTGQTLANPLKVNSIEELLGIVLDAAVKLGAVILTIALIWCGFLFVAARGNDEKISKAKTALMWTVIGGLILLGAKGIQTVITSTVNGITN